MTQHKRSVSTDGVVCPFCSQLHEANEDHWFDEEGYDFRCFCCDEEFFVQPEATYTWTSTEIVGKT